MVPGGAAPPRPAAPSAPATSSARARPTASEPPNNWASRSAARRGPGSSRPTERPVSGTCTCSTPEQPDLDWSNPEVGDEFESTLRFWLDRGVDGFRIDVANGLAKHSELPDLDDRFKHRLTDEGHPHWDRDEVHEVYRRWRPSPRSTTETGRSSPRRGCAIPNGSRATCDPTSCTPRSTSTSSSPAGTPASVRRAVDSTLDAVSASRRSRDLGAVEPRRHPSRHPLRRRRAGRAPSTGRRAAHARPSRRRVHLPGRGARPARGRRPAGRGAPGPDVPAHSGRDQGTRRMPGADSVVGRRAAIRFHDRADCVAAAADRHGRR